MSTINAPAPPHKPMPKPVLVDMYRELITLLQDKTARLGRDDHEFTVFDESLALVKATKVDIELIDKKDDTSADEEKLFQIMLTIYTRLRAVTENPDSSSRAKDFALDTMLKLGRVQSHSLLRGLSSRIEVEP